MQIYNDQTDRRQDDYRRSRNPFEYGQQVAQRRYAEIMAGLDAQKQATQRSYGDMYQEARQRAVRNQAMGGPSLSGGMGQQRRDYVSALEMQELSRIGGQQQQAMAELYAQQQAAFSNAQLEGQQATQMELQNRSAELEIVKTKQDILGDTKLSVEEKTEQLAALGVDPSQEDVKETSANALEKFLLGAGLTAVSPLVITGIAKVFTLVFKGVAIGTAGWVIGGVALLIGALAAFGVFG